MYKNEGNSYSENTNISIIQQQIFPVVEQNKLMCFLMNVTI